MLSIQNLKIYLTKIVTVIVGLLSFFYTVAAVRQNFSFINKNADLNGRVSNAPLPAFLDRLFGSRDFTIGKGNLCKYLNKKINQIYTHQFTCKKNHSWITQFDKLITETGSMGFTYGLNATTGAPPAVQPTMPSLR